MKKILSATLVAIIAIASAFMVKADEKISADQLPQAVKAFVADNFGSDVTIVRADRDRRGLSGYEYDVVLSNGVEIDFGVDEKWVDVESELKDVTIPESIVGEAIMKDISTRYPGQGVRKIERKYRGFEVKLTNHKELIYDKSGNFKREDYD